MSSGMNTYVDESYEENRPREWSNHRENGNHDDENNIAGRGPGKRGGTQSSESSWWRRGGAHGALKKSEFNNVYSTDHKTVPEPSRWRRSEKYLFVDGLNFATTFFVDDFFNVANVRETVKSFMHAATASGYKVEVFLDNVSHTAETINIWRERRENEVREGTRRIILGLTQFIADSFRECDVIVHLSVKDNDDTIASHANARGGDILSGDRDFFRYYPRSYRVFDDFEVRGERLNLRPHGNPRPREGVSERTLPSEPIKTCTDINRGLILNVLHRGKYIRGVTSSLIQTRSNIHLLFRPLRRALYFKLQNEIMSSRNSSSSSSIEQKEADDREPFSVAEEFPIWNSKSEEVEWQCDDVTPSDEFMELLSDPAAAVETFGELQDDDSFNHVSGVWIVALELICRANPDGPSLLEWWLNTPQSPGFRQTATSKARNFKTYFTKKQRRLRIDAKNWRRGQSSSSS